MGEEFTSSDCSWKKMVIAKANNEWISTIKSKYGVGCDINDDNSLDEDHMTLANIKKEKIDVEHTNSSEEEPGTMVQEMDNSEEEPETLVQEMDPLIVDNGKKKRRRRASGPRNETSTERTARLARMSAYAAQRLANETPTQRSMRLKRMSEYSARRLAQESSEQRARRLARMSAYAAKRFAEETFEQREARLARMSAYAARRLIMKKGLIQTTIETRTAGSSDTTQLAIDEHNSEQS